MEENKHNTLHWSAARVEVDAETLMRALVEGLLGGLDLETSEQTHELSITFSVEVRQRLADCEAGSLRLASPKIADGRLIGAAESRYLHLGEASTLQVRDE